MEEELTIVSRDKYQFYFDPLAKPVVRVRSGQTIEVQTERADSMYIHTSEDIYLDLQDCFEKQKGGGNPCTGPIYIEGAESGDNIEIKIEKISVVSNGYTCIIPGQGGLVSSEVNENLQAPLSPKTIICEIVDNRIVFPVKHKTIQLPLRPFIGTIAVATSNERRSTIQNGREFLGNVDCPLIEQGTTLILPVNVSGALLYIGDVHALQGHGEISGTAIECRADITITLTIINKQNTQYVSWPQINDSDFIGSIACVPTTLEDAVKSSYIDLIRRMERFYGFDQIDAYQLLSQVGELLVCQSIATHYACVARIHKSYL